jgi:hypothetical protein
VVAILSLFLGYWFAMPIFLIAGVNTFRRRVHPATKIALWLIACLSVFIAYQSQIYLREHLR